MAKPNKMAQLMAENIALKKMVAQLTYDVERMKGFTLQQALDMAEITLHKPAFGFGPERNQLFEREYKGTFMDYAGLCVSDGEDDAEIVYTKACVDRSLIEARGPDTLPFDDRYADENLFYRDRDLKQEGTK